MQATALIILNYNNAAATADCPAISSYPTEPTTLSRHQGHGTSKTAVRVNRPMTIARLGTIVKIRLERMIRVNASLFMPNSRQRL